MTKRKLSSLIFTLVVILVLTILQRTNPTLFSEEVKQVTPSMLSEKKTVLGSESAVLSGDTVKVVKVIDGDTIEIEGGQKIRYIGVDTPETKHPTKGVQCYGKEASLKNKELVEGKQVRLEKDVSETDRYGRLLRFVYVDPSDASGQVVFVNDYLVRQGYALLDTVPPNVGHANEFRQAEQEARENNRGLWGRCGN